MSEDGMVDVPIPGRASIGCRAGQEWADRHSRHLRASMSNDDQVDRQCPSAAGHDRMENNLFTRFMSEIDHRTTGEILAHPDFPVARKVYIPGTCRIYEKGVFPANLLSDAGPVTAIGTIICLFAQYDESDRATWPTLSRLKDGIAAYGFSSPRLIDGLIVRLRETGNLEIRPVCTDGRVRLLWPTEKLLTWDREVLAAYYAPLQILYPKPGYGLALSRDPAFQRAQRRASLRMPHVIASFTARNTDVLPFMSMTNAVPMLFTLSGMGAEESHGRIRGSDLSEFRDRFGVSRSHIRNVLTAAEEGGLLHRTGPSGAYLTLTPRWRVAFDRFIGDTLASSDMTYRMALDDLNAGSPKRNSA